MRRFIIEVVMTYLRRFYQSPTYIMIILELTLNLHRLGYMKNLYRDTWSYFMTRDNDSSMTFAVIF